jgi:hypothetical protein
VNNNYKKEKEKLQKELDSKVNMEQIYSLSNQIKISEKKLKELEEEKEALVKIQEEHFKCEEEKAKIKDEIKNLQKNLDEIRKKNKEKSKKERNDMSLVIKGNNNSELYKDLNPEQKKAIKEQQIQEQIDKYWRKNERLLNTEVNEEENEEAKNKNNSKKMKFMNERSLALMQKQQNYNNKMAYSKKLRNAEGNNDNESDSKKSTELPKIPLFNQNEKKVLINILPEKEIQKYEKRFEYMDKEKDNLLRKYVLETKQLQNEKKN